MILRSDCVVGWFCWFPALFFAIDPFVYYKRIHSYTTHTVRRDELDEYGYLTVGPICMMDQAPPHGDLWGTPAPLPAQIYSPPGHGLSTPGRTHRH